MEQAPQPIKWPPRFETRLPRDWQDRVVEVGTTLDPYEDMAREAETVGPSDVAILLELLEGADILGDELIEQYRTIAATIYGSNVKQYQTDRKLGRTARGATTDYSRRLEVLQDYINRVSVKRPLLRRVVGEISFLLSSQVIESMLADEKKSFDDVQTYINTRFKIPTTKIVLTNILRMKRFDLAQEFTGPSTQKVPSAEEIRGFVDLYRDVDLVHPEPGNRIGVQFMLGRSYVTKAHIELDPTVSPWRIGTVIFIPTTPNSPAIQAAISRFGGHLCPNGFSLTPMSTFMNDPATYARMQRAVWFGIDSAFAQGLVVERRVPTMGQTAESDVTTETTQPAAPAIQPEVSVHPAAENEKLAAPHLPWLSYRQYTRFLRACGVKIVPHSKHLRAEYGDKSVSALNEHRSDHMIPPAELQDKLDYLGIPPEIYLKKLPGRLGKMIKKTTTE